MATANVAASARTDWILSNPWLWSGLGFCSCGLAWLINVAFDDDVRLLVVFLGLLATGGGVALRLQSTRPSSLAQLPLAPRNLLLGGMALLLALVVILAVVLWILAVVGMEGQFWKPGQLAIALMFIGPICGYGAFACLRRFGDPQSSINEREESALILVMTALSLFLSCFALYNRDSPDEFNTIRLFLAIALVVCLVAAPLMLLPQTFRRIMISLLIFLHFGGIATATMAAHPSPWLVGQIWTRIYRPYLEFMYLNNAYHFYSPAPGPASQLWFRMFFTDKQNREVAIWYKMPEMDDKGNHGYKVSLIYQRILASTENTSFLGERPAKIVTENGKVKPAKWWEDRLWHSPNILEQEVFIGKPEKPKPTMPIPINRDVDEMEQYLPPSQGSRWLLESYARHVARKPHPDHPDWKFKSVKIYRVIHNIIPTPVYSTPPVFRGMNGLDPELYRPYYMGEFNEDGYCLDDYSSLKPDPFLYWLLPILRDNPMQEDSLIRDHARRHAGDPRWIRAVSGDWVEERLIPPAPLPPKQ